LAVVVVAAALGALLPGPGRALDRRDAVDVVLAMLVAASALEVPAGAAASTRRLGGRLLAVLVAVTVTLPALADALSRLLTAAPLREAVLAVGVAPAEVATVGLSGLAGGDVAVAASLLIGSTVASVLLAGPILSLLAGVDVSAVSVLVQLAGVVALPLVLGLASRRLLAAGSARAVRDLPGLVAVVAVVVLVWLVAAEVHPSVSYLSVTVVLAALLAAGALGGWALGRLLPTGPARSVLLFPSMRDFAVASGIATAAFGPAATGPLGVYGVLVIAWGAGVATVAQRRRR